MSTASRLHAVASAVPPHVLAQEDVVAQACRMFPARASEIERLLPAFRNAGIQTRYSCVPLDWYLEPVGWRERNRLYLENAEAILQDAAERCLERAGLTPREIDSMVLVSTSGLATPSLDARLMERLPFRRDVQRLPIFGLGCAGGVLGLARAAAMARAMPGSKVLFLVVELCGLTFRAGDHSKSNIIAAALFGDGAAAAVLSHDEDPDSEAPVVRGWGETTWPDSLDVMGWRVEEDGLGVLFSKDIPTIVRARFGDAVDAFLAEQGLSRLDLAGSLCHPGGAKVIEALEEVLDCPAGTMAEARGVLHDYGNMSAATVLFVLERALAAGLRGRHLMASLGPGFTAGFLLLEAP